MRLSGPTIPKSRARLSGLLGIEAAATNHNGRSASLTAPSGPVQQALFRRVLSQAGVEGAHVNFVELHGTGTKLGDPIEAQSTAEVFESPVLVLGAVKSNMGHLEGSAGMAGIFKLITVLRSQVAPPNLHIYQLNQHVSQSGFFPDALMQLTPRTARRGAVSSFGFGGSNAQAMLVPGEDGGHMVDTGPAMPAEKAWLLSVSLRCFAVFSMSHARGLLARAALAEPVALASEWLLLRPATGALQAGVSGPQGCRTAVRQ